MQTKTIFHTSPISYSQFLASKNKQRHQFKREEGALVDIDFFKHSISNHYQHVYASQKWKNWVYRFLFFAFSLLFVVLGFIILFKTVNFAYGFYFKNPLLIKNGVNFASFALAAAAFAMGAKIHPEKDAMQHIIGKVHRELNHPAKHLQIEFHAILANLTNDIFAPGKRVIYGHLGY